LASLATASTERASIETFRRDVIEASMRALVLVDFWAPWCGPCKTFTPTIERVVATYAPRVVLVKIDIDKNPTIAAQLRVQSVPTVFAFLGGQPVDAFAGAVGEHELKAFIDRLLTAAPSGEGEAAEDVGALVEAGLAALADGAGTDALAMFRELALDYPERADVAAGLARALLAGGDLDGARGALDALPETTRKDAAVAQARAAIELARVAVPVGDLDRLRAEAKARPDEPEAAFALADALIAAHENDEAADTLLAIIERDPAWNEGAARARLLTLFEAVGLVDPWVAKQRRRLAAILFR